MVVLINIVSILMMSANLASPGLLNIKVFWNTQITWHTLEFCYISIFFTENQQLLLYREIQIWIVFQYLTFIESLMVVLINIVTILMMSAKLATPGLLNTKVFWNKDYGVIIYLHDVISKALSHDSNFIVDVVV